MTVTATQLSQLGLPVEVANLLLTAIEENAEDLATLNVSGAAVFGGALTLGAAEATIVKDASNERIAIAGGTSAAAASGAMIRLNGSTYSGANGFLDLFAGSQSNAKIRMEAMGSSGTIDMSTNSALRWVLESDGDFAGDATNGGNLIIARAGRGLHIKEGSNARMGQSTLTAGSVVVANTSVTASTRVFLSRATSGGTAGHLSVTISAGVSFTISSSSGTDTSTINWLLVEAAA